MALYIYFGILTVSFFFSFFLLKPRGTVLLITIAQSAGSAVIGFFLPDWLLWTINGGMIVAALYSIYVINKMQMWTFYKTSVVVEEDYDVDENRDEIPADVLKAWSEVYNAPQD
jgi:hypothetical protein